MMMTSLLAKIITIVAIIFVSKYNLFYGVLILLLYISYENNVVEGMENSDSSSASTFRKENCKDGKLMKDGSEVSSDDIKTSFPNLKMTSSKCNPCDESCEFDIIDSKERLTTEENLRSKNSKEESVDRKKNTKKSS
jgi:hypothetical protein